MLLFFVWNIKSVSYTHLDVYKRQPLETSEMFIDGFRLGARMMIEIYQKDFTIPMNKKIRDVSRKESFSYFV